jgi:hypothetical protein
LAKISDATGWEPFKLAFQYIDSLPYSSVPATSIGKLNLFLTKVWEYSGVDIFSMITAKERAILQTKFGGTIPASFKETLIN